MSLLRLVRRRVAACQLRVAVCITAIALAGCGEADLEDLRQFVATTKASSPGKKLEPPPEVEPYRPFTYTAQGLKDPFIPSPFAQQRVVVTEQPEVVESGVRPDPNRPREELEKYSLGSLKMVGTFRKESHLWALVEAPDKIVHRVQIGNYIGTDHGQIVSITERRIDLTEIVSGGESRWVKRDAFLSLAE